MRDAFPQVGSGCGHCGRRAIVPGLFLARHRGQACLRDGRPRQDWQQVAQGVFGSGCDPPLGPGARAELATCCMALFPPLMVGHGCRPALELLAGDRSRADFDRTQRPDRASPRPKALSATRDGPKSGRLSGLLGRAAKTGERERFSQPPGAEGPPRPYRRAFSSARLSMISSASRPYNS